MKTFNYFTQSNGTKTVILFDKMIHGFYLVEVNTEGMADKDRNYKFDTYEKAEKKFNSIKKRVLK